ncbi:MAG: RsmB/NOP family class I SAM-dependent RNA methyltransferase [Parvularculaceae bacterium]
MRDSGRIAAAIDVLTDFETRRVPLKTALADWARGARYAGAKDRAWISGLCLDALRKRNSLAQAMGDDSARSAILAALRFSWGMSAETVASLAAEEPHGPGALTADEKARLSSEDSDENFSSPCGAREAEFENRLNLPAYIAGDFPEWLTPHMARVFGDKTAVEGAALAERADVDLRLNTLKAEPEKALAALAVVGAGAVPYLSTAARIPAPDASDRAPAVTIIPAFNKGWVEVQDLGSQIAALAAGETKGAQVLDLCAGGGGKTLALAALMENTGQLYAYDEDARRLQPLYERSQRAGVRNLQIRNPAGGEGLDDLEGKMDLVSVDAPCTGSGTWRRHPDTKWRLTPQQLERRMAEQDSVLDAGARYVKPGGRLVFVTCSIFMEECEDRVASFLSRHPDFSQTQALDAVGASGLLMEAGRDALEACKTPEGALRITPLRLRADGFFVATLARA